VNGNHLRVSLTGQTFTVCDGGEGSLVTGFHGRHWNVGNTNQIAELLIISFTFSIGHMIGTF